MTRAVALSEICLAQKLDLTSGHPLDALARMQDPLAAYWYETFLPYIEGLGALPVETD